MNDGVQRSHSQHPQKAPLSLLAAVAIILCYSRTLSSKGYVLSIFFSQDLNQSKIEFQDFFTDFEV
jgi:hypothetical protein